MLNQLVLKVYGCFVLSNRQRKPKGQSGMDNSVTLSTLGAQDTGRRQIKQNILHKKLKG